MIIFVIYCLFFSQAAYSESLTIVQNLISTTHSINTSLPYTQIRFTWSAPSGYTAWDGYYVTFDQNSDTDFQLDTSNTTGDPVNSTERIINCSGDDENYYVHIAPALYDFQTFEYIFGTTSNMGPYRIDTTPPILTVIAPIYANANPIDLTIGAIGAIYMCISNIEFGDCAEWNLIEPFPLFNLSSVQGNQTIYVQVKDDAGNFANETGITYFDSISPKAIVSIYPTKDEKIYSVSISFSEPVSDLNPDDISIENGVLSNFMIHDKFPYSHYTFDLKALEQGKGYVIINDNAVFDIAGNGYINKKYSFVYCSRNVPALNEWGVIFFMFILMLSALQKLRKNSSLCKK